MKIYVYTPLHSCWQGKELINEEDFDFEIGNYEVINHENIIVKDIGNSILIRIFYNFVTIARFYCSWYDDSFYKLREERKRVKKINKNIIGFIFVPLFYQRKKIEFKLIECDEQTVLKIYRTKDKNNFYYEVYNGKVEVVYNGKVKK